MNISRHSLIFGLSYAIDIAVKEHSRSHSKNTAYLSFMLGKEIGLDENDLLELYYSALLHDIGLGAYYDMERHCIVGADILRKLPLPEAVVRNVYCHHELLDGTGPLGLKGDDIPLCAMIICLSSTFDDEFDRYACTFDYDIFSNIKSWLNGMRLRLRPEIVAAFENLIRHEYVLLEYFNQETRHTMSQRLVIDDPVCYNYDDVLKYAMCFADMIDQRSPFTYTHSRGIARLARKAARHLGYDDKTQNKMYIAGMLHDIGKLHTPIEILHKESKLMPEERFEMNKHTYFTRKILEQIQGFDDIANYAANHHEKIDGTGYPNRIPGERLSELERVMAICDVYQALTEVRPYRNKMSAQKAHGIISSMASNGHLDRNLVETVLPVFADTTNPI